MDRFIKILEREWVYIILNRKVGQFSYFMDLFECVVAVS